MIVEFSPCTCKTLTNTVMVWLPYVALSLPRALYCSWRRVQCGLCPGPGSPCFHQHHGLSASASRWYLSWHCWCASSLLTGNPGGGIRPCRMRGDPATLPWVCSPCTVAHCAHLSTYCLELPHLSFCDGHEKALHRAPSFGGGWGEVYNWPGL